MNSADRFNRHERVMKTKGMPIHTIIAHGLLRREDWEDLGGAKYPRNGHWWGRKKNGKIRYIGPVRESEKRYIKKADRGEFHV